MRDVALSINLYFCNLMADERQRGGHKIVQSRGIEEISDLESTSPVYGLEELHSSPKLQNGALMPGHSKKELMSLGKN